MAEKAGIAPTSHSLNVNVSVLDRPVSRRWLSLHISERRILLVLGDLFMLSASLLIGLWLRVPLYDDSYGSWQNLVAAQPHWWIILGAMWLSASLITDAYNLRKASDPVSNALHTGAYAGVVCGLYLLIPPISPPFLGRLIWFTIVGLSIVSMAAWRLGYVTLLARQTFARRVLIVGAGGSGRTLAQAVRAAGDTAGIEVVGFIDDDQALKNRVIEGARVLGASDRLVTLAHEQQVDEVVVAITDTAEISAKLMEALVGVWEQGVEVIPMPLFYEEVTGSLPVEHIGKGFFALIGERNRLLHRLWSLVTRLIDLVVGAFGIIVLLPLLPLIALAIRLDSRGPIFYRQQRVGQGGKNFWLTKFRSMVQNAEDKGAQWCTKNDCRVTRVGRLMRKMRIDELPQLWNLLVGDMSLVGPRPERPEFVPKLGQLLPYYQIRHCVKPGLTGWAQVCYRYASSVDDAMEKLKYDLYYVKHRGPVLYTLILLRTIRVVLQMQGT